MSYETPSVLFPIFLFRPVVSKDVVDTLYDSVYLTLPLLLILLVVVVVVVGGAALWASILYLIFFFFHWDSF